MSDWTTPSRHRLTPAQFTALGRGGGDVDAVGRLVAGQRSKHLILLAKVAALAGQRDHPDDGLAVTGQELLAQVQRADKAAADEVTGYPSVGAWALHTIRGDQAIPGARPSGLAAVAAAAAIRAGLDAEIEVPVVNGAVLLPSLGAADATGSTAVVTTKAAGVVSGGLRVEVRQGAPGWRELRPVTAGSLRILVDDLDPFRMPATDGRPTGTAHATAGSGASRHGERRVAGPIARQCRGDRRDCPGDRSLPGAGFRPRQHQLAAGLRHGGHVQPARPVHLRGDARPRDTASQAVRAARSRHADPAGRRTALLRTMAHRPTAGQRPAPGGLRVSRSQRFLADAAPRRPGPRDPGARSGRVRPLARRCRDRGGDPARQRAAHRTRPAIRAGDGGRT